MKTTRKQENRIFLGGTCANSTWREQLIPHLNHAEFEYFNPVVEDWTPECIEVENIEKEFKCGIHLYILTPEMKGVYSIAEIVDSVWTSDTKCWVGILGTEEEWGKDMWKSLKAVIKLIQSRGCDRAAFINKPEDILTTSERDE